MTTYVINRFQQFRLPTFNAEWQALCDRCANVAPNRKNHANPHTPDNLRCAAVPAQDGQGPVSCSEARHYSCACGELFKERQ